MKLGADRPKPVRADVVGFRGKLSSEALMVVESKRRITSDRELKNAREQCESYCGKLRCSRFAVAAPEGIWVYNLRFPTQSELLVHVPSPSPSSACIADQLELLSYKRLTRKDVER